jgi:hypothetical protein
VAVANARSPEDGKPGKVGRRHRSQEHEWPETSSGQEVLLGRYSLTPLTAQEAQDEYDAEVAENDEVFRDHLSPRLLTAQTPKEKRPSRASWDGLLPEHNSLKKYLPNQWRIIQGNGVVEFPEFRRDKHHCPFASVPPK